jgi:hypothetical protein
MMNIQNLDDSLSFGALDLHGATVVYFLQEIQPLPNVCIFESQNVTSRDERWDWTTVSSFGLGFIRSQKQTEPDRFRTKHGLSTRSSAASNHGSH